MSIADVYGSKESIPTLMSLIFHDLLFTVRSLKHLFLNASFCRNETITISSSSFIMETSDIERLTLTGIQINLHDLLVVAPKLRGSRISPIRLSPTGYSPMAKVPGCIGESTVDSRQLAKVLDVY
jgi:hypothetical protein